MKLLLFFLVTQTAYSSRRAILKSLRSGNVTSYSYSHFG